MEKDPCAAYFKRVKRKLRCSGETRRRLLAGLELEAADAFPQGSVPSPAQVLDRFGPPEDLARELESALPPEEVARAVKRRRLILGIGFAVCAAVIVLLIVYIGWLVDILNGRVIIDTEIIYKN